MYFVNLNNSKGSFDETNDETLLPYVYSVISLEAIFQDDVIPLLEALTSSPQQIVI